MSYPGVCVDPELARHLKAQAEGLRASQELLKSFLQTESRKGSTREAQDEGGRVCALVGAEFLLTVPILKDSDPDFESHWRRFQAIFDCHVNHRGRVRPAEQLSEYRRCFQEGSVRLKVYETQMARATRPP